MEIVVLMDEAQLYLNGCSKKSSFFYKSVEEINPTKWVHEYKKTVSKTIFDIAA